MGAFHEGHLELMRQARQASAMVAVSLFVNPTQFGPNEDLARYPRQEEKDLAMAESVGVDLVFAPSVGEMYEDCVTRVRVEGPALGWEGDRRPGHFEGVATVVLKLFNLFQPRSAFFGLKDLQQCAVIRQMVKDLDVPIRLHFVETVREPDGLALSSRNAYLTDEQRRVAPQLHRILVDCASGLKRCEDSHAAAWDEVLMLSSTRLQSEGFDVEYVAAVDAYTMQAARHKSDRLRVIGAAKLGSVRLIDNVPL